ncbi:MAG: cation:proton antiporter, partial [Candidatus Methanomethylophilaceae archaeon]|nr:cation:proton antiporter [Candidatus Methanomethylophilaceae archaeon]
MDLGIVFLTIVLVLFLAKISSVVFEKFGIPGLVGEILIGIVIANLVIGDWSFMKVLDLEDTTSINSQFFFVLAEMGVIFLLFSVGLEMRVCDLMKVGRTAFLVASLGIIFPFIFGFVLMLAYDGNMYHALFLGAAMVATSVGITAKVIKDLKVMNTKESRIIIGAAVIDDIIGMIVLAVVVGMAQSGSLDIISIGEIVLKAVIFVVAILFLCSKVVPRFDRWWRSRFIPRPC